MEPVNRPTKLKPIQDQIEFGVESAISSVGFYTKADLKAYAEHIKFSENKTAITSSITRMASGLSPASNALAMHNLFSMEQAKGVVRRAYLGFWLVIGFFLVVV